MCVSARNVCSLHDDDIKVISLSTMMETLRFVPAADWDESMEDPKNADLWDKSWDDDKLDDDFARQLREQLTQPQQQQPPQPQKTS